MDSIDRHKSYFYTSAMCKFLQIFLYFDTDPEVKGVSQLNVDRCSVTTSGFESR